MLTLPAKSDLTMQTHAAIRSAIMSGELAPCAPLAQEELADRLGVSRQPISHALKLLKHEGLVVDRGRKGQMVAPIDAGRLLALYQVRGALDRLAAQLTASSAPLVKANQNELEKILMQGTTIAATGNIEELVQADVNFHCLLNRLSGNLEIGNSTEALWPHLVRAMRTVLEDRDGWQQIWREHRAIAEAVLAGNSDQAGELAARHAEQAGAATHHRLQVIQKTPRKQT